MQLWQLMAFTLATISFILLILNQTGVISLSHLNPMFSIICVGLVVGAYWVSVRHHLFLRHAIAAGKLIRLRLFGRGYTPMKRITSCRKPAILHEILCRAAESDLKEGEISPKRVFKRWVSFDDVLFRIQQDVLVSEGKGRSKRIIWSEAQGFYSIFRITPEAFVGLRESTLDYDELNNTHLARAGEGGWLFILDFELATAKGNNPAPIYLLCDVLINLRFKINLDNTISGVATLVATPRGDRFAQDLGFIDFENYYIKRGSTWKLYHMSLLNLSTLLDKFPLNFSNSLTIVPTRPILLKTRYGSPCSRYSEPIEKRTKPGNFDN